MIRFALLIPASFSPPSRGLSNCELGLTGCYPLIYLLQIPITIVSISPILDSSWYKFKDPRDGSGLQPEIYLYDVNPPTIATRIIRSYPFRFRKTSYITRRYSMSPSKPTRASAPKPKPARAGRVQKARSRVSPISAAPQIVTENGATEPVDGQPPAWAEVCNHRAQ